jgi:putative ABC transport system permease protein
MKRRGMFLHLVLRSALVKRGRTFTTLLALAVASGVATAMLTLYAGVDAKLHSEFRAYGANVVITGPALGSKDLQTAEGVVGNNGTVAPFAYVVAKTDAGAPVVVAGADFARVQKLDHWWSVTQWPARSGEALVGERALSAVFGDAKSATLNYGGRKLNVSAAGVLKTGGDEDSRIYIPLTDFNRWAQAPLSSIEVSVNGSAAEVEATMHRLAVALPRAQVSPVRQIVEAEGRVLSKARAALLASVLIIIVTATLCLLATLTASVLERRKDFAVMKALGGSQGAVNRLFAAEAAALGIIGSVLGYVLGTLTAAAVGRANFQASIAPDWAALPWVVAATVLVALFAAMLPMTFLRQVEPASMLRGE